jgi:hypothetical protein
MKLSVPSRLQTSLIDGFAAMGVTGRIAKVYESPPLMPIGHGRVGSLLSRYGAVTRRLLDTVLDTRPG